MQVNAINSFSGVNFHGKRKHDKAVQVNQAPSNGFMHAVKGPLAAVMFIPLAALPSSCDEINVSASASATVTIDPTCPDEPPSDTTDLPVRVFDSLNYYRYILGIPAAGDENGLDNRVLTKLYGENNWDYDNPGVFELNLPKSSKEIAFYDYRTKDKTKTFPLQILESGNEYEFYDKDGSVRKGMGGVMYDDIFMQSRDGKKVMVYQYQKNGEHAGAFEELGSIEPGYLDKEQYGNNLLINDILSSHGTDYHYINVEATVKDLDEIVQMAKYSD